MDFMINDEKISVEQAHIALTDALAIKGVTSSRGIAVAVNDEVIPHVDWGSKSVQPNDKVLIITATQGG